MASSPPHIHQLCWESAVVTDSGGIQEEASFLGKKCIVCRQITERVEGMGIFSFMCPKPTDLAELFKWLEEGKKFKTTPDEICPYGDGNSSKKIADILSEK